MRIHTRLLQAGIATAIAATLLVGVLTGCDMLKNVPSILKITVLDQDGNPYGYVAISIIGESGLVKSSGQANDRGILILGKDEGMMPGTYSFVVKNVAGKELEILSPESVSVGPGRTVEVIVKVGPPKD